MRQPIAVAYDQLRTAGVSGVEIFCLATDDPTDRIKEIVDAGLEPVIHLAPPYSDLRVLEPLLVKLKDRPEIKRVIIQPSGEAAWSRDYDRLFNIGLMANIALRVYGKLCIENLPYNSEQPERYGSVLTDITEVAQIARTRICFDSTSHIESFESSRFASLEIESARQTGHLRLSAYRDGRGRLPLQEDDETIAEIVEHFRELYPEYMGLYCLDVDIEADALSASAEAAIFGSIEKLKELLG